MRRQRPARFAIVTLECDVQIVGPRSLFVKIKQLTSVGALVVVMFGLAACGSDAKKVASTTSKSAATTTTEAATTTTEAPETTTTEESPDATDGTDPEVGMTDAEFATAANDIVTGAADATDICALGGLYDDLNELEPSTAAQLKSLLPAIKALFGAIADTAPADKAASAAAIRKFVVGFEAAAQKANYDPDNVDPVPVSGFNEAMEEFQTALESC